MSARKRRLGRVRRASMRSPGRPPVLHRSARWPFWQAIADGCSSEDAARRVGVSPVVGVRWFRECGGMPPSQLAPSAPPPTGRYLSLVEREQIALLRARRQGVREIARRSRPRPCGSYESARSALRPRSNASTALGLATHRSHLATPSASDTACALGSRPGGRGRPPVLAGEPGRSLCQDVALHLQLPHLRRSRVSSSRSAVVKPSLPGNGYQHQSRLARPNW